MTQPIKERLNLIDEFLERSTKIEALEEIVWETKQKIMKLRIDNEHILERMRFQGEPPGPKESEEEQKEDEDLDIEVEDEESLPFPPPPPKPPEWLA
jgi:hypothetical protein